MATINLTIEAPKTIQRTILAVGQIHYQPPAGGQPEALDVTGWMIIRDETRPNDPMDLVK
jgi:hypothetical protein